VLQKNTQIKELDLSRNKFGNIGCENIFRALHEMSKLAKLSLSNCITNSFSLSIGYVLPFNSGLKEPSKYWL